MPSVSLLSSYLLPSSNVSLVRIRRLNSSHYFEGETLRKWQPTTWHSSGPYGLNITMEGLHCNKQLNQKHKRQLINCKENRNKIEKQQKKNYLLHLQTQIKEERFICNFLPQMESRYRHQFGNILLSPKDTLLFSNNKLFTL